MNEITEAFHLFDKDNSGQIDTDELKDAMRALGVIKNKHELKALMEKADKDGSGQIEIDEFKSLMAELFQKRNPSDELEKAFKMYDDDDGGTIDLENLQKVARELYDKDPLNMPDEGELKLMIMFGDL